MKIKRLHPNAILPHYATDGASAFDVFAYENVEWKYNANGHFEAVIKTGWAFEIPHEHGLFIFSRSGHGFKHSTTLVNSVGLLDYDYRGELMVKLMSMSNKPPEIKVGTAVAQCVLMPTPRVYFCEVDELSDTKRGISGFGSTGI
jgi:dUTP pyrophosphatase